MKTIELMCACCGNKFFKDLREYKRRTKCGKTDFFCSRSCAAVQNNRDHPREGDVSRLDSSNRRDEFTPFRWFVLRAQNRDKRKHYGCDLTVEYLKSLWENRKGICSFTGWQMILPRDTNGWDADHPSNASIDRLDNSKGYIQGNVRFISLMANYARNKFSDEQLKAFCKAVSKHE